MSEWKECTLGSVLEVKYGKDHKNLMKGTIPCLGSGGIMRYVNNAIFQDESILIPRKGSLNNIMFQNKPFWTVDTMFWTKINKEKVFPKFLFYQLTTIDYENLNVGSAVPSLTVPVINEIEISLPSLLEQRAIASVLSSLDDKIDLLHRQNATLEKMAETLFRQWFVEEAVEQSVNQLLLGDLIESVSVTHKFPASQIIFLNTSDISDGNVLVHEYSLVKTLPGQAKKSIQKNDILFSEIRPANGRYAYVDFDAEDYVVSTKLMVLRSKNKISQAFIYFYLTHPMTVDWLQLLAESRSGTFPQITFDQIKELKINIPSETILSETIDFCESALKKLKFNQNQIRTLTSLRDTLLPKLMSGEVRVEI